MEEEMSTYTFIIESEVCNTGFEIGLGFFSKVFPVQGCVQWCFTAVFFTLWQSLGHLTSPFPITLYML